MAPSSTTLCVLLDILLFCYLSSTSIDVYTKKKEDGVGVYRSKRERERES